MYWLQLEKLFFRSCFALKIYYIHFMSIIQINLKLNKNTIIKVQQFQLLVFSIMQLDFSRFTRSFYPYTMLEYSPTYFPFVAYLQLMTLKIRCTFALEAAAFALKGCQRFKNNTNLDSLRLETYTCISKLYAA